MSDRWGAIDDNAKLRERVAVIETNLTAMRSDNDRQFRQLNEGQAANRAYTEEKLTELTTLIKASPAKPQDDRLFRVMLLIGGVVALILILFVIFWISTTYGGRA